MNNLPPDSVLRLARALGLEEFFACLELQFDGPQRVPIPLNRLTTPQDLWNFCVKWDIKLEPVETDYLRDGKAAVGMGGPTSTDFGEGWTNNTYPLYLDRD